MLKYLCRQQLQTPNTDHSAQPRRPRCPISSECQHYPSTTWDSPHHQTCLSSIPPGHHCLCHCCLSKIGIKKFVVLWNCIVILPLSSKLQRRDNLTCHIIKVVDYTSHCVVYVEHVLIFNTTNGPSYHSTEHSCDVNDVSASRTVLPRVSLVFRIHVQDSQTSVQYAFLKLKHTSQQRHISNILFTVFTPQKI